MLKNLGIKIYPVRSPIWDCACSGAISRLKSTHIKADINVRCYIIVHRAKTIAEIGSFLPENEEMLSGLDHTFGTAFVPHIDAANFPLSLCPHQFNYFVLIFQPSLYAMAKPTVDKNECRLLSPTAKECQSKTKEKHHLIKMAGHACGKLRLIVLE